MVVGRLFRGDLLVLRSSCFSQWWCCGQWSTLVRGNVPCLRFFSGPLSKRNGFPLVGNHLKHAATKTPARKQKYVSTLYEHSGSCFFLHIFFHTNHFLQANMLQWILGGFFSLPHFKQSYCSKNIQSRYYYCRSPDFSSSIPRAGKISTICLRCICKNIYTVYRYWMSRAKTVGVQFPAPWSTIITKLQLEAFFEALHHPHCFMLYHPKHLIYGRFS